MRGKSFTNKEVCLIMLGTMKIILPRYSTYKDLTKKLFCKPANLHLKLTSFLDGLSRNPGFPLGLSKLDE